MQSTDRQMRKEAMTAWGDLYEEISGELDALYDKMVPLRDKIAKKLGFSLTLNLLPELWKIRLYGGGCCKVPCAGEGEDCTTLPGASEGAGETAWSGQAALLR